MKFPHEEDQEALVKNYSALIDESYETILDFHGYTTEAKKNLDPVEDVDYLRRSLAASGARAPEVVEAKKNLDEMVQELEIDDVNSLEDFLTTAVTSDGQAYTFKDESQYAIAEALNQSQEKLEEFDKLHFISSHLEGNLGNISFRLAL